MPTKSTAAYAPPMKTNMAHTKAYSAPTNNYVTPTKTYSPSNTSTHKDILKKDFTTSPFPPVPVAPRSLEKFSTSQYK
eukprot:10681223-Ditylum_brightwellii.AAC.1